MQFNYLPVLRIFFWISVTGSYILAMLPQDIAPHIGSLSDKGIHFFAFAVLSLLLGISYTVTWIRTLFLLTIYAVFIELSQLFTQDRSAEILDIIADMIGIGIGSLFYLLIKKWIRYYTAYEYN